MQINKILYNFLWNGNCDKVKWKIVCQKVEKGGIKMIDINHIVSSAKNKCIKRYFDTHTFKWLLFEHFLHKKNLNVFLRSNYSEKDIATNVPVYHRDSLLQWKLVRVKENSEVEDFIWYNCQYLINRKSVYSQSLFCCGLWMV